MPFPSWKRREAGCRPTDQQADEAVVGVVLALWIGVVDVCSRRQIKAWRSNRSRWLPLQLLLMADSPYLLAIALFT
ncbi:MAG: hypothetical protein QNK79_10175 [Synechococcus sp. ArSW.bin.68]